MCDNVPFKTNKRLTKPLLKSYTLTLRNHTNMLRLVHCNLPLCFDMQKMAAMLRAVLAIVLYCKDCQKVRTDAIHRHYTVLGVFSLGYDWIKINA